jgi:hypothetical protein
MNYNIKITADVYIYICLPERYKHYMKVRFIIHMSARYCSFHSSRGILAYDAV